MKVALVADSIVQYGGAHNFLMSLKKIFPSADVFTNIYEPRNFHDYQSEMKDWNIKTSVINKQPFRKIFSSHYSVVSPFVFEQFDFNSYDVVITLSAGAAKSIITSEYTKQINIILTPVRYSWCVDKRSYYTKNLKTRKFLNPFLVFFDTISRIWDYQSAKRSDITFSISHYVKELVSKIYNIDSDVLFPPVTLKFKEGKIDLPYDYYVCLSRLYPYKKIDDAIRVCMNLKKHLIIIGTGPDEIELKNIASGSKYIHFLGFIDSDKAYSYIKNAKALIFPGIEDFGIVMVESILLGTPVIALGIGGSKDIVNNSSGILFNKDVTLSDCIINFEKHPFRVSQSIINGYKKKFGITNFRNQLFEAIK